MRLTTKKAWKIALFLLILDQNQKYSKTLNSIPDTVGWNCKKTISRYCPFEVPCKRRGTCLRGKNPRILCSQWSAPCLMEVLKISVKRFEESNKESYWFELVSDQRWILKFLGFRECYKRNVKPCCFFHSWKRYLVKTCGLRNYVTNKIENWFDEGPVISINFNSIFLYPASRSTL
jgi:hypothetical protein